MYRDNRRGMIWTREHNDILRKWIADGRTVREIRELAEETFQLPFTSPQIRSHVQFLGLEARKERAEKKDVFTPEMKEWIYDHRELPPTFLVKMFRSRFGEAAYKIPPKPINGQAASARIHALKFRTEEEINAEWEKVRKRISPKGQIAAEHWLWRYLPLDEKRTGSGVVFREG